MVSCVCETFMKRREKLFSFILHRWSVNVIIKIFMYFSEVLSNIHTYVLYTTMYTKFDTY